MFQHLEACGVMLTNLNVKVPVSVFALVKTPSKHIDIGCQRKTQYGNCIVQPEVPCVRVSPSEGLLKEIKLTTERSATLVLKFPHQRISCFAASVVFSVNNGRT